MTSFGMNLMLWTGHVTERDRGLLKTLKKTGFDVVEFPVFDGTPDHYARMSAMVEGLGLKALASSALVGAVNPLSADKAERVAAVQRTKWAIDCSHALGAPLLIGPMHSAIGQFTGVGATKAERAWAISYHRAVGDHALKRSITFGLEALNRFECYFLNTMEQLADYLDEVDHPAVKAMFDTFHANIEEKDLGAAIRRIRKHLVHVHISENDRGVPGRGHVPWTTVFDALRGIKYRGPLVIESFGRALPELAAATKVWRDFFPSKEAVYREGLRHMKKHWPTEGR